MIVDGLPRLVAIHGAPRSGTSWLGQLFNSSENVAYRYQPFFSHAFRGRIDASSGVPTLRRFFGDLLQTDDEFVLQRGSSALAGYELAFAKRAPTHLVYKEVRFHDLLEPLLENLRDLQAIGIMRDPGDVIASWVSAPREFRSEWAICDEWYGAPSKNADKPENWYGFSRWRELAHEFIRLETRFPDRFSIVRYEDLLARPESRLEELFRRVGLAMTDQVYAFIRRSASEDDGVPYGVLRNWRNRGRPPLDPAIRARIETELAGDPAARFLKSGDNRA